MNGSFDFDLVLLATLSAVGFVDLGVDLLMDIPVPVRFSHPLAVSS